MTCIDTTSKRRLSAKLAAGLAISALLVLGAASAPRAPLMTIAVGGVAGITIAKRPIGPADIIVPAGGLCRAGLLRAPPAVYYGSGVGVTLPGVNFNFR